MDFENSADLCDTFDDRNSCEDYLPLQSLKDIKNSGIVENIKPEAIPDVVVKVKKKRKRTDEEKLAKKLKKLTKQNLVQCTENGDTVSSRHQETSGNNPGLDIKIEIDVAKVKNECEITTNPEKSTEKNIKVKSLTLYVDFDFV